LFEAPQCTAGAAAAALISFGFAPNVARGLVSRHRPTADQVRAVIANARAWAQAHAEGRRGPLNNPIGFVRSQITQGHFEPDAEVQRQTRQAERVRAKSQELDQAEQEAAVFDALSDAERERLKGRVLAAMRKADPAKAGYFTKHRPQDEPLHTLIARAAMAEQRR